MIQTPNQKNILIDGGPRVAGSVLVSYLKLLNITELDAVIATHPHEDHIGGLIDVFANFKVQSVYFPNKLHTTVTFERFLEGVNKSGAKRVRALSGRKIDVDSQVNFEILSPFDRDYDSLNHVSVVARLTYKNTSFLFTGDAEIVNEDELLRSGLAVDANVLKVGHHGSSTSSSLAFLQAVDPQVAVISVAKGNSYNHPHQVVIDRFQKEQIMILRTDEIGTIVLKSDGDNIFLLNDLNGSSFQHLSLKAIDNSKMVYISQTGKRYHKESCYTLKDKKTISLEEAISLGYSPCQICKP